MKHTRRTILSALGVSLPFGFVGQAKGAEVPLVLGFRPFEEAVRAAFEDSLPGELPCRRVEVGHSEVVQAGVQGCHNDRPFAGFPAGHLRIVRSGSEPGGLWQGVRLYVSTVDVVLTGGTPLGSPSRPLDFSTLPPAPTLS